MSSLRAPTDSGPGRRSASAVCPWGRSPTSVSARKLLAQLVGDNTTLAHLVTTSDDYITALAGHRRALTDAIDGLGRTLTITARHHRALAGTLAEAPGTLRTANRFLSDLQATT